MFGTSTPAGSSSSSSSREKLRLSRLEWSLEGDSGVDLSVSNISGDVSGSSSSNSSSLVETRRRSSFLSGRARYSWWIGRERLDILRLFQDMNAGHLFALLGSYLRGPDFVAMSFVSKTWNSIVSRYFHIPKVNYLISLKSDYENSGYEEHHLQRSTPRKAMSNVSNLVAANSSSSSSSFGVTRRAPLTSSTPLPTSPSKIRHRLFTEEASKLSPGECLQSCPRCTNPSRVILSESRATCSRISCGFDFCTKCMCSAHVGTQSVCRTPTKSSGKISNKSIVSTKKSRRRLKRL